MTKKHTYLMALLGIVLTLTGCKKAPIACLELSQSQITVGETIEFSSCSENALSYEWFIVGPEGAPENDKGWSDPMFMNTFTVPGAYTVTLNAYSKFSFLGDVSTAKESFNVD